MAVLEGEQELCCRICFQDGEDDDEEAVDRFLYANLCSCRGSIGCFHRRCLEEYLSSRANALSSKLPRCEICSQPFQIKLSSNKAKPNHVTPASMLYGFLSILSFLLLLASITSTVLAIGASTSFQRYADLVQQRHLVNEKAALWYERNGGGYATAMFAYPSENAPYVLMAYQDDVWEAEWHVKWTETLSVTVDFLLYMVTISCLGIYVCTSGLVASLSFWKSEFDYLKKVTPACEVKIEYFIIPPVMRVGEKPTTAATECVVV